MDRRATAQKLPLSGLGTAGIRGMAPESWSARNLGDVPKSSSTPAGAPIEGYFM